MVTFLNYATTLRTPRDRTLLGVPDGQAFVCVLNESNQHGDLWVWSATNPGSSRLFVRDAANYAWAGAHRLVVVRGKTSAPYRFQNGANVIDVP